MEPIGKDDDVMTVAVFQGYCRSGAFIDYDGFGHFATDKQMQGDSSVYPSTPFSSYPAWATHIVWFNR